MLINPDNWSDGEKYFQGCYIQIKEYNNTLCLIDKVTPEGLFGIDELGDNIHIDIDGEVTGQVGYNLDYILPKACWFQHNNFAFYLSRIPARMWKKGLHPQNTKLQYLRDGGMFKAQSLDWSHLKSYIERKYRPYTSTEGQSLALNSRFALSRDGTLFLNLTPIGKYYRDSNYLAVKALFYNDVKPLFEGARIGLA